MRKIIVLFALFCAMVLMISCGGSECGGPGPYCGNSKSNGCKDLYNCIRDCNGISHTDMENYNK